MGDDRREGWPVRSFGLANPLGSGDEGNVPALLRRAADVLEEHGDVHVLDVTLQHEFTDDAEDRYSVRVYFASRSED